MSLSPFCLLSIINASGSFNMCNQYSVIMIAFSSLKFLETSSETIANANLTLY